MKQQLKKRLEQWLARNARAVLEQYKPQVVGVTGSVGKTSTKNAIAHALLASGKRVRTNQKNYNNEIGLPLTVFGLTSPGRSLVGWIGVWRAVRALRRGTATDYPEILVLEMGIDHPGDMDALLNIVKPDIGVLTNIGASHLEHFANQDALTAEKRKLVEAVPASGLVILNHDNTLSRESVSGCKAKTLTYGFSSGADIQASDLVPTKTTYSDDAGDAALIDEGFVVGANFKVQYSGKTIPFYLHRVLGRHQVLAVLPAIAVGEHLGMNILAITEQLRSYRPPRGRMNLLSGIKHTLIIDDTYNAAPESTIAALRMLRDLPNTGRRVAVLADMLELGAESEKGHREVGAVAGQVVDLLITFGPRARFIAASAREAGLASEQVYEIMDHHRSIEDVLQPWLKPGDIVLVKGSQSMRMEFVVKAVMAEPLKAEELLVRQEPSWLTRPYVSEQAEGEEFPTAPSTLA